MKLSGCVKLVFSNDIEEEEKFTLKICRRRTNKTQIQNSEFMILPKIGLNENKEKNLSRGNRNLTEISKNRAIFRGYWPGSATLWCAEVN
jgi:hypothetical protein